jgi:hypothetical protein
MRLYLCGTAATNGSIVHFPDDTCMKMEQLWNDIDRGKPRDSEKTCPFAHHISHVECPGNEHGPTW